MPDSLVWPGLFLLGASVGVYGTLIGVGGGFLLVPILLFLFPELPPQSVTALSLGVVFFNAASGSLAYGRQRRIDYEAGAVFALASIPSAVLGALATGLLAAEAFEVLFGLLLIAAAVWLQVPRPTSVRVEPPHRRMRRHSIEDIDHFTYVFSFDPILALFLGFTIGVGASLFGVGGGIFQVPAMVLLMRMPSHIATSTSTFVLMFTGATGALVHLVLGHYSGLEAEELSLATGSLFGAQIGAVISRHLASRQEVITRFFSLALLIVAARMLLGAFL